MGSRLAIPAEFDLTKHAFKTRAGRVLAITLQSYGGIVVDRGGPGTFIICTETRAADIPEWNAALAADLAAAAKLLRRVEGIGTL